MNPNQPIIFNQLNQLGQPSQSQFNPTIADVQKHLVHAMEELSERSRSAYSKPYVERKTVQMAKEQLDLINRKLPSLALISASNPSAYIEQVCKLTAEAAYCCGQIDSINAESIKGQLPRPKTFWAWLDNVLYAIVNI